MTQSSKSTTEQSSPEGTAVPTAPSSIPFRVTTYIPAQRNPFGEDLSTALGTDERLLGCTKALRNFAAKVDADAQADVYFCDLVVNLARSGDLVAMRDVGPLRLAIRKAPLRESAQERIAMFRLSVPYKGSDRYVDRLLFIEGRAYESLRRLAQDRANLRPLESIPRQTLASNQLLKACNRLLREAETSFSDIRQVLKAAAAVSILRRTPVACYSRTGHLISHAPADEALLAVGHRVPIPISAPPPHNPRETEAQDAVIQEPDPELEFDMNSYRSCFRHQAGRSAHAKLAAWEPILPASKLVRDFCLHKLSIHRKPATTYRYGSLIMSRVVARLDRQSPLDISLEDLESVYEQAILDDLDSEDVSHVSDMTRRALAAFHQYLRRVHGVASLDDLRTILLRRAYRPVDSIIVTVDDFERALAYIRANEDWKPLREGIVRFALIAFYGGLRSSELYHLRLMDFRLRAGVDVAPYGQHTLKSCSSRRRIPLWEMMPPDDATDICEYIQELQSKFAPGTRWTETILGRDGQPISEDIFRSRGLELFRAALNMPEFRFHSLRHSAANLILLKLAGFDRKRAQLFFRDAPKTLTWIEDGKALRKAIFFDPEERGCELLAVSSILGHAHPVTTVTNYIHLLEFLR